MVFDRHCIVFALAVLAGCSSAHSMRGAVPTFDASALPAQWRAFRLNPELNPVVAPASDIVLHWTFKTDGGISSSPTLSRTTLFVASNDKRLYALDLSTGAVRWSYLAGDELMTAPLIANGIVVVGEGNNHGATDMFDPPHYLLLGDGENALIGLSAATGKVVWKHRVPGSAMATGALIGDTFVHHDSSGMLFGYDAETGAYRWREYLASTPAMVAANNIRGSEVVTAGDYPNAVIAFDGNDGRVLWRTRFADSGGSFDDCPLAADGRAIYGMYLARPADSRFAFVGYTTPGIQHAYALDATTGTVLWDVPLARGVVPINNSAAIPVVYRGTMYVGSALVPEVFALDARTGVLRWRLHARGAVKGGMVAVDGVLYFGDLSGYYWAVDAASGRVVGRKKMPDGFNVGSPIVVGKSLIVGSKRGYVFALPLASIRNAHDS